jgi:hypothetical protein
MNIMELVNIFNIDKDIVNDDQGEITQDAYSVAPPSATKTRNIIDVTSDENAAKRLHDSIVHTAGHKVHPSKVQRMNQPYDLNQSSSADNVKVHPRTAMIAQDLY